MLVHIRDAHGHIDALTAEPAAKRSARRRVVALVTILVMVLIALVATSAFLGVLVRVFNLFA